MTPFDPYHIWLGIPAEDQPPSHYRLLGIAELESHPDAIDAAAERRTLFLRTFQTGDQAELAEQVATEILTYCLDVGGSLTGEHGIGADKACHMPKMFTLEDLDTMQLVRAAFDPDQICNPGKLFPTPRLCGEVPGPYRVHPAEVAGLVDRV